MLHYVTLLSAFLLAVHVPDVYSFNSLKYEWSDFVRNKLPLSQVHVLHSTTGGSSAFVPCVTEIGAAYIHLPFCRQRCFYCDFPIKVVGHGANAASQAADSYVQLLINEMSATQNICEELGGNWSISDGGLRTIFFGGGTPSLVEPELIGKLLEALRDFYGIAEGAEISMEMDPGTFNADRLRAYRDLGVNRVSLGVQTFDGDLLQAIGRAHTGEDNERALRDLEKVGVENFSLDLLGGLPGLTAQVWESTLRRAIATGAPHLSVYDLQVEERSVFGRRHERGQLDLPPEEDAANMFRAAHEVLSRNGPYEHYEISNFARPGYQCLHNRVYWENKPYLAFGNAAASYLGGRRFSRPRLMAEYRAWVQEKLVAPGQGLVAACCSQGGEHGDEDEAQLTTDELLDTLMLGLRLQEGVDLSLIEQRYGKRNKDKVVLGCQEWRQQGAVVLDDKHMWLTRPEGYLISNQVISSIFASVESS